MSALLALDIGNSNIVAGLFQKGVITSRWRLGCHRDYTVDEYGLFLLNILEKMGLSPRDLDGIAVSNVVPSLCETLQFVFPKFFGRSAFFVSSDVKMSVKIALETPSNVGADLIAAAECVLEKYGAPAVIIDMGTATTFSALTRDGVFLGGAIAPGLAISAESLYMFAPHLPRIPFNSPPRAIGSDTVAAMQSGIITGHSFMIRGMVGRMKEEMGESDAKVIASGGLAQNVKDAGDAIDIVDPDIVLEGAYILYLKNNP